MLRDNFRDNARICFHTIVVDRVIIHDAVPIVSLVIAHVRRFVCRCICFVGAGARGRGWLAEPRCPAMAKPGGED